MTLDELRTKRDRLWDEVNVLREAFEKKREEWHALHQHIQLQEQREQLRTELRAELEKEKAGA